MVELELHEPRNGKGVESREIGYLHRSCTLGEGYCICVLKVSSGKVKTFENFLNSTNLGKVCCFAMVKVILLIGWPQGTHSSRDTLYSSKKKLSPPVWSNKVKRLLHTEKE